MVTQKEGCKRRCRGQKREESIAYATTTGLVVMNCREEEREDAWTEDKEGQTNRGGRKQQCEN